MTGRKPRHLGVQLGEAVQLLPGRLAGTDPGMAHGQQVRASRSDNSNQRPAIKADPAARGQHSRGGSVGPNH
jgi:hypothetical protein